MTDDDISRDASGRAYVWTYRSRAMYGPTEDEARATILAEAYRMVPAEVASASILSIRKTPTGRFSAIVKRVRS